MQAQEYPGARWSVGLRSGTTTTVADIELAIAERRVVRTWPMRGTLHFVAAEDVRWMLPLLTPRVVTQWAGRHAQLGLTQDDIDRSRVIVRDGLAGGVLERGVLLDLIDTGGVTTEGQRGYHLIVGLAMEGLICQGPMAGKQQTFVLLDEWVPPAEEPPPSRPAALARLAERYLRGHGPATVADLSWWSGLTRTDVRAGIEGAGDRLQRFATDTAEYWLAADVPVRSRRRKAADALAVHLLPGFDEYYMGYTDRSLQLGSHRDEYAALVSANGVQRPTLVVDGQVAGVWRRTERRARVDIAVQLFRALGDAELTGLHQAAQKYGRFLGLSASLDISAVEARV
jgi:hypothetical protein